MGAGAKNKPVRGRGADSDPANRFESVHLDVLPEGGGDEDLIHEYTEDVGDRRIKTTVFRDRTRTVINPVDSPDIHFNWSINPYRGCEHGCIYCYARPTHETLGLSCGLDFETKIFAKIDAPAILRRELARPAWEPAQLMMSGVTDPYQPVERKLELTRSILGVLRECNHPVSLVTKNALIARDIDLLQPLAALGAASTAVSITSLDPTLSAAMEPRAASPARRLETVRALSEAGIPVTVLVAPVIPGLNDTEIPGILEASRDHGARGAGMIMLRLPWQVKELFTEWLGRTQHPSKAARVESLIRQTRGGELYNAEFKTRMRGEGTIARHIHDTFGVFCRRLGLRTREGSEGPPEPLNTGAFVRPELDTNQLKLF